MKIAYITHSLASCWNHGNAHFLRGVLRELQALGHEVRAFEPEGAWSLQNLLSDHGPAGLDAYRAAYPELSATVFTPEDDPAELTADANLVIVHEWNEPALVAALGAARKRGARFTLFFHDTHHRAVSEPDAMQAYDLSGYDGVLAFGETLAEVYRRWGWRDRVWTWHEAADTRLFHPPEVEGAREGLVWIGNWGDGERSAELETFLFRPAREAGLPLDIYGVRYPDEALRTLTRYGVSFRGWLPNARAPEVYARHLATVHVPRRFYTEALPGIPTIRVFEALACGIPLVCAPWEDSETLFRPGEDYLVAHDGAEMTRALHDLRNDPDLRAHLIASGLATIRSRHSCAHRARELLDIVTGLSVYPSTSLGMNGSGHVPSPSMSSEVETHRRVRFRGPRMKIAFYGSSLVSSYWNGAATYYRGLLRDLAARGHEITFYEPDAFDRQQHRDMDAPDWARSVVYDATPEALVRVLSEARTADVVVKASGVGVFDTELLDGILAHAAPHALKIFWDVDAAATLDEMRAAPDYPLRAALRQLDLVFTYGGGDPVVNAYRGFGARRCVPIYNALDPSTHHPVPADPRFTSDLAFLGNRLPDREARVDEFFLAAARLSPDRAFLIGGNGWQWRDDLPGNVRHLGHVGTGDHNAFNCTPLAVLNVARDSMAHIGFSPATRVFEAAGAAACLITDAWEGIELFLAPDTEVLVARDGQDVAEHLAALTPERARAIGEAALSRVLKAHTYTLRGALVDSILREELAQPEARSAAA